MVYDLNDLNDKTTPARWRIQGKRIADGGAEGAAEAAKLDPVYQAVLSKAATFTSDSEMGIGSQEDVPDDNPVITTPAQVVGTTDMSGGYLFNFGYNFNYPTQKIGFNINGEDTIKTFNPVHHNSNSLSDLVDNFNHEIVGLPDGIEAFASENNLGFRTTATGANQTLTIYNVPNEPAVAGDMYQFGYDWETDPQDFKIAVNGGPLTTVNLTATATTKQETIDVINTAISAAGLNGIEAGLRPGDERSVAIVTTYSGAGATLNFAPGVNDALGTLRILINNFTYRVGSSGDFATNVLGMILGTYTGTN